MIARPLTVAMGFLWISAIVIGQRATWRYETTPGDQPSAPVAWPAGSRVKRSPRLPTLVMLAHPQCPCTRASVEELNGLMARCQGRITTAVLFYRPRGAPPGWEKSALWRDASRIPGVQVLTDLDGQEARRFRVQTSGQTNLYDADGHLLFSGGITATRGHEGENAGVEAIVSLVTTGKSSVRSTPVFGCVIIPSYSDPPSPTHTVIERGIAHE